MPEEDRLHSSSGRCEILAVTENQLSSEPKRSWTVRLEDRDPFCQIDYDELRWYLEDYAVADPYARDRAQNTSKSQLLYGQALVTSLTSHLTDLLNVKDTNRATPKLSIHLIIRGDGTESSLHGLLWEIIERDEKYDSAFSFFVSHIFEANDPDPLTRPKSGDDELFNILYVSARPGLVDDISYRAISRHIVQLLKSADQQHRIRLHFSRPGTWKRLQTILTAPGAVVYNLIHFDMHGSIVKSHGQDVAVLHFAPAGTASKKPDRKSAAVVAKLLAECKVRLVILNACNSATTKTGGASNLACTFASYGIQHVAAMTYRVKTDAAALAMKSLYRNLIHDPADLPKAVGSARPEIRSNKIRTGRYGLEVPCEDEFNLVLYSAQETAHPSVTKQDRLDDLNIRGLAVISDTADQIGAHQITRIQDLDMLSLEDALDATYVVFVSGESGTGKSTLAKLLSQWWKGTFFAEDVHYFDSVDDIRPQISALYENTPEESPDLKGQESSQRNVFSRQPYSHGKIVLLDNIESFDPWPQSPKEPKRLEVLKEVIADLRAANHETRILVFTRLPLNKLLPEFPDLVLLEMSLPTLNEAFSMISFVPPGAVNIMSENAAEIEDVIKSHHVNLLFTTTFLPLVVQTGLPPYQLVEKLLDEPSLCLETFNAAASKRDSQSAFKLASDRILAWPLQTDLACRMILPFCMFQRQFPLDARFWLYKLLETGAFSGCRPRVEPYAVETGNIHDWDLADGWENFPPEWTFEESLNKVQDCLVSLGLLKENVGSADQRGVDSYQIHPLLPYFLRSEISKLNSHFRNAMDYQLKLRQTFWEYYEIQAVERINIWSQNPEHRVRILTGIQLDDENMLEAIRLGLKQPMFPFRSIKSHHLTTMLNFVTMPQPRVRRWANLFSDVLTRFERIVSDGEWRTDETGQKIPPEQKRLLVFINAISVTEQMGRALEELGDRDAIVANADRAVLLRSSFAPLVDTTSNVVDRIIYAIQVQKAKCITPSEWTSKHLDFLVELLTLPTPDIGFEGDEGRCKLDRVVLANHLLFEKAWIPEEHSLHDLIAKYSSDFDLILSDIFTNHVGLSQLGTLRSRDFFIRSGRPESTEDEDAKYDYTTRTYATETSRRLQKSFELRAPSNSRGYLGDAVCYAMDPDAVDRGDTVIFNEQRLQNVYDKAKQVRFKELEALCLQQLGILAVLSEDPTSAESYFKKLEEIGGSDALPNEFSADDLKRQKEFSHLLETKMKTTISDRRAQQQ